MKYKMLCTLYIEHFAGSTIYRFSYNAPGSSCALCSRKSNYQERRMDPIDFGYSMKNIPITTKQRYKILLTEKVESVLKRMRWKAIFYEEEMKNNPGVLTEFR